MADLHNHLVRRCSSQITRNSGASLPSAIALKGGALTPSPHLTQRPFDSDPGTPRRTRSEALPRIRSARARACLPAPSLPRERGCSLPAVAAAGGDDGARSGPFPRRQGRRPRARARDAAQALQGPRPRGLAGGRRWGLAEM